ncbi:ATP-binding cassette sub-family C member 4-like isoform X5 [Montipora foliosa]
MAEESGYGASTHPQSKANWLSFLLFWWTNDLFKTGYQRPIQQSDFWPLHEEDKTCALTKQLQSQWTKDVNESRQQDKEPRLWKSAMKVLSRKDLCIIVFAGFLDSVGRFLQPFFLGVFITTLMSTTPERMLLSFCAVLMLLVVLMKSVAVHHSSFKLYVIGMRLKASLKGLIFQKILLMGQQTLNEFTKGHVIDLVSNDVQRMELAARQFFRLIVAVFDVCVVVPLLWHFIGWQALMGFIFLCLLVPFGGFLIYLSGKLRVKIAAATDKRIHLMAEIVAGIREIKTHAWEWIFQKQVEEARRNEMRIIRRKSILVSCGISIMYTSGVLAAFISLLTLAFSGCHLTPYTVFTLLSMINVLRNSALRSIAEGSHFVYEAYVSFDRIQKFLLLPELQYLPYEKESETYASTESLCGKRRFRKATMDITDGLTYFNECIRKSCTMTRFVKVHHDDNDFNHLELTNLGLYQTLVKGNYEPNTERGIRLTNVTCRLNGHDKIPVEAINFEAEDETLTIVTGPVGSGKSSFMSLIAGEIPAIAGNIDCNGTIAYVPQMPWVFSGTLRENVLFGLPFHYDQYMRVIKACALEEDIARFPDGDEVVIGERGNTLSGGQQTRISLARAVYANCDIYLLDNPLASLDANVGDYIFNECILGMLSDKLRLMVSHKDSYMNSADQVVVMDNGSLVACGTFVDLNNNGALKDILEFQQNREDEKSQEIPLLEDQNGTPDEGSSDNSISKSMEIPLEDRATGTVSFKLYWNYFRAGLHPLALAGLTVMFLICQGVTVLPDLWLSFLTTLPHARQIEWMNISIYAGCVAVTILFTTLRAFFFFIAVLRSSEKLHNNMATGILKAPVLFFDSNPIGRILNRFAKDTGCLDEILPQTFFFAIQMVLFVLTAALLPLVANAWLAAVVVPLILLYVYIARYFMRTSRELKRLEAVSRSPVLSQISETLDGLDTIRSRGKQQEFAEQLYRYQDTHSRAYFMVLAGTRWLGIRLDLLSGLLIGAVAFFAALQTQSNAALVGIAFVYVFETAHFTQVSVQQSSEVENLMTSVERVMAVTKLEPEPGYKKAPLRPKKWPTNGKIELNGVSLRYYPEGPMVLNDVNLSIAGQSKVGIVGRTGAGKSSIIAALKSMPEAEGVITIDGVRLSDLNLQESRMCISVFSQDPVVFSGTIRENLDPLSIHTDADLWDALEAVHLKHLVETFQGKLSYGLTYKGMNLSVGEKQLLCLARVLLQGNNIVILDEPAAHLDPRTEQIIQETIQERLADSTVITISHRPKAIEHCDKIVVLSDGQVIQEPGV